MQLVTSFKAPNGRDFGRGYDFGDGFFLALDNPDLNLKYLVYFHRRLPTGYHVKVLSVDYAQSALRNAELLRGLKDQLSREANGFLHIHDAGQDLLEALQGLRNQFGCWCDTPERLVYVPWYRNVHSDECIKAKAAIEKAYGRERPPVWEPIAPLEVRGQP